MNELTQPKSSTPPAAPTVAVVPFGSAIDALAQKLHGEVAVLAVIVCILIAAFVAYPNASDHRVEVLVAGLVLVALVAMGLIARRKETRDGVDAHQIPVSLALHSNGIVEPASLVAMGPDLRTAYWTFKSRRHRVSTRLFMLLGALLYAVFALLDWLRAGADFFWEFAAIRVVVVAVILALWLLSFAKVFERIEVVALTFGVIVAGTGVLMMIWRVGMAVDFYQAGLVQVFMFAGLLLWLPTRHVVLCCAYLIAGYCIVVVVGELDDPARLLTNAAFSLGASALICVFGNMAYHSALRKVFYREVMQASAAAVQEREAVVRRHLLGLVRERLANLRRFMSAEHGSPKIVEELDGIIPQIEAFLMAVDRQIPEPPERALPK